VGRNRCSFIRGDANHDTNCDLSDAVTILFSLFDSAFSALACQDAGDTNDDGVLDVADVVKLLNYLFGDGTPLPAPFPGCGIDPTDDLLLCEQNACE
jgi:hypothetical protein